VTRFKFRLQSAPTETHVRKGNAQRLYTLTICSFLFAPHCVVKYRKTIKYGNTVHARNSLGQYYTILESNVYKDETTGLAFSPDAKHLYFAYQETGLLFDITRIDGLPFNARTLNVKYHRAV